MVFDILHSFIDIFVGGRSDIKALLFIFYILLLALLSFVFHNRKLKKNKWPVSIVGFNILLMYLYNIILQLYFTYSKHLFLMEPFIVGNNNSISSSVLWHSHIAKGVVGQILSLFGANQLSGMDTGNTYVGLLPPWVFYLGGFIFLSLLLQVFFYFIFSFYPTIANNNLRRKIFFVFAYSLISFAIVETSIDGGFFVRGFFVSVILALSLYLSLNNNKFFKYSYFLLLIIGVIVSLISGYMIFTKYSDSFYVSLIGTFLVLSALVVYGTSIKINWKILFLLIICFFGSWWVSSLRSRGVYDYAKKIISVGQMVFYYDKKLIQINGFVNTKQQTINQIAKKFSKNITYEPIAVRGLTCNSDGVYMKMLAYIQTDTPLADFKPSPYIIINHGLSVPYYGGYKTQISIFINTCTPEPLSVLNGEFLKNGFNYYILENLQFL